MKKGFFLFISFAFFLSSSSVFACWGARPLSMGGAFVAVADDVHSIYWNPAGLAKVKKPEITYTRWLNLRDLVNYDDFVAGCIPLKYGTLGIGYTYNRDNYLFDYLDEDNYVFLKEIDHYVNLGYGISFFEGKLSIGMNVKLQSMNLNFYGMEDGDPFSVSDGTTGIPLDFGILWDIHPRVTIGILFQNFNEPTFTLFDETFKEIFNLRPGIAFRINDRMVVALDVYDVLNNSEIAGGDLRFGFEAWITENLALRLGAYHFNNDEMRAITGGIGIRFKGLQIDYGIMYWDAAGETQHLLGITYKF